MKKLFKSFKILRNLFQYYLCRNVLHLMHTSIWMMDSYIFGSLDMSSPLEYSSGVRYASKAEKYSMKYRRIMKKLCCFKDTGPVGPNKYWEYPWAIINAELSGFGRLKILDAGCGRSPIQFFLAEMGHEICGVDSEENVPWHGIDRNLALRFGLDVEYRLEGMENLSYKDNLFDRVFCLSVLEHCRANTINDNAKSQTEKDRTYQGLIMKQLARVLKPGGILVITVDFNLPTAKYPLEANIDCKNLIESSNLEACGEIDLERVYGSPTFSIQKVINDSDIDIVDYQNTLQTSIGIKLKKPV